MNQNGKHISACMWDSEDEDCSISVVLNYVELVNNIFNLQKFDFMFSQSSQSKHLLVV